MPEAVTQLTTPVTAICYNLMLASLIGDIGVSTFSVLSFIYSLANAVLSGVAQGLQPLWSHCYGRQDTEEMAWYFRRGIVINSILSIFIYGILFVFDTHVICIFNRDAYFVRIASAALPLFLSLIHISVVNPCCLTIPDNPTLRTLISSFLFALCFKNGFILLT